MLIMIGASASGKTEIAKELIKSYGFKKMVTYTTRTKRENEVNDIDYHFISKDKFFTKMENSDFLETSLYNENYYGTAFKDADTNRVLIVDPDGANSIYKKKMNNVVFCYLETESIVREKRMYLRGDDPSDIEKRLKLDSLYFTSDKLKYIDFEINTSTLSIAYLTKKIYDLYTNTIK